jgi:tetratricopeptide (TPR) repeat protein
MSYNTTTSCIPNTGGTQDKFGACHSCVPLDKKSSKKKCYRRIFMKKKLLIVLPFFLVLPFAYSQDAETNRAELLLRLEEINAAIVLAPRDTSKYLGRAEIYSQLREYEKAVEDLDYLLVLNPDRRDYYYFVRANIFNGMGKYHESLEDSSKAIEYMPMEGRYYFPRGVSYAAMGMDQEAIIAFTKAIELRPIDDYNYHYNRGNAYFRLERYQEAIADYTKAIELGPVDYKYYYYRGKAYDKLIKYQEAIDDYTRVIEINPRVYQSFHERGLLYVMVGMPDKAIDDINHLIKIWPTNAESWGTLYGVRGMAYRVKGNSRESYFKQAIADFTRAIEYEPIAVWFDFRAEVYELLAKKALRRSVKNEYLDRAKRDRESAERIRGGSE